MEQALAMETGGRAIVHYMRTGIVCDVFLPTSSVTSSGANAGNVTEARVDIGPTAADATPPEVFRILVVENSFLLVIAIKAIIDYLGWVVVGPATRRSEALALARSELLDVNLDGEMS